MPDDERNNPNWDDEDEMFAQRLDDDCSIEMVDALNNAVWDGDVAKIKQEIANGTDIDTVEAGNTALELACEKGDLSIVKLLVEELGADVNVYGEKHPLVVAREYHYEDIVEYLKTKGAKES